ncbi:RNA polymerase sigma-54 factor [Vagococcus penaei]|uniref:RNA polymerase sigma-54 factor n=1 Tax=Vagococcus penaei TaxID=633807 RepID=A0A1Q2D4P5_9ENTE|nr:RNA polymerase factor sigma-54 [Vagococcus penaei]AQP53344.1 RNA polymerase sigma-54 factor [Vagococcus penaei]RSU04115.1 RNA polymerase sigma-54 factor [Vagococcus penaei]
MRFEQHLSQQQKQTQKLAMTQQLQQSIKMLQFSTPELLSFLENKSLENPLLEVSTQIDDDDSSAYSRVSSSGDSTQDWLSQLPSTEESLFEYVIEQIHLNYRDTYLRQLTLYLVEFLDVNGYLTITLEQAMEQTQASYIELLDALRLLQVLDPAGIGARNLQECLMLQTERDDQAPVLTYIILEEFFEELADRKWPVIEKALDTTLIDIQEVFDYVQRLSPFPGARFGSISDAYIIPDLMVRQTESGLSIQSTKQGMPKVTFQENYFKRMSATGDPEVKNYLADRKKEFEWIQSGVDYRGDTILRIGEVIVKKQHQFFLDTTHPLVPMLMKDVATELDIHESTVSRCVNGKYLQTEFGVYELKTFFGVSLPSTSGDSAMSTEMIKRKVKEVVEQEDKSKPLSDQKIVELLKGQDITLSRRTVAKYRDELNIPSSSKRKRYEKK